MVEADLTGADLSGATLSETNLSRAIMTKVTLQNAALQGTTMVHCNLQGANLSGSRIYGVSAWDLVVDEETVQADLIITPDGEPEITVDNIKVAQFIYLLLSNPELREVIETITSRAVLILGNFSPARKAILDAVRNSLRENGFVPIMFDFEKPRSRSTEETLRTLASISKYVIADLTDARSVLQEIPMIVSDYQSVPLLLMRERGSEKHGMLDGILHRPSVVKAVYEYVDLADVVASLKGRIITPLEKLLKEIRPGMK